MQLCHDVETTNTFLNQKNIHVSSIVSLHIAFESQITKIHAHGTQNICTTIILGMNFITLCNLKFIAFHGKETFRFVVQYEKLNLIIIIGAAPLSKLELKAEYYQIAISRTHKAETTFATPFRL
jgi:hypothetical protein